MYFEARMQMRWRTTWLLLEKLALSAPLVAPLTKNRMDLAHGVDLQQVQSEERDLRSTNWFSARHGKTGLGHGRRRYFRFSDKFHVDMYRLKHGGKDPYRLEHMVHSPCSSSSSQQNHMQRSSSSGPQSSGCLPCVYACIVTRALCFPLFPCFELLFLFLCLDIFCFAALAGFNSDRILGSIHTVPTEAGST